MLYYWGEIMKKIYRFVLLYLPFLLGLVLFSFGTINLVSSLCLFLGGYVALKNTLDYRLIKKNKKSNIKVVCKKDNSVANRVGVINVKKIERVRVRKK